MTDQNRSHIELTSAITAEFLDALMEITGDVDMTIPQALLLIRLQVNGQTYQNNLTKFTKVQKSANSRNVAKMGAGEKPHIKAGPGYIRSEQDPIDRRHRVVSLTEAGRKVVEQAAMSASKLIKY
ncbi:MAG: winged helix-turn-helix transcriptional regulator [Burkholderiales bacterium]|nr:winged helix-turn-helix transcriptional regulator [Burkholderiales bacterium]